MRFLRTFLSLLAFIAFVRPMRTFLRTFLRVFRWVETPLKPAICNKRSLGSFISYIVGYRYIVQCAAV